ncbi:hypothetical protein TNCV_1856221, partial [Trichonephila clavipes]
PDGHGYELVSSVGALVPQKFSVEEELMHVKHVEVKSPHVGVMWKFGRKLSAQLSGYGHELVAGVSWARVLLPLKTRRVDEAIPPADVVVRKEGFELRCPLRHSTKAQNYEGSTKVLSSFRSSTKSPSSSRAGVANPWHGGVVTGMRRHTEKLKEI